MKKTISILLVIMLLCTMGLVACDSADSGVDQLTIYNWADYIYDFEDDFAEYYYSVTGRDVEITYVTFDTNETMLTKLKNGDSTVDVICPSEYAIQQLLEADMLVEIDYFGESTIYNSNSQYVDHDLVAKVCDTFDDITVNGTAVDITEYLVPYMWGTIGVLYNLDAVEEMGLTADDMYNAGWGALFNKDADGNTLCEGLNNRIYMKDSVRDSYAATLCYLYDAGLLPDMYSNYPATQLINTVDDTVLALVEEALLEQKDVLYGYEVDFGKNDLIVGNAYVDLAWSGDAMYAIEEAECEGITLDYYVPETSNVWLDGWVIPKTSSNIEGAQIFIDFLNDPYVSAQNMMEIGYTSAIDQEYILASEEAMAVMCEVYCVYAPQLWTPEEDDFEYDFESLEEFVEYFFTDIRYPDASNDSLGVMVDFGDNTSIVTNMWENVKSAGVSAVALLLYTVLALVVAVGVFVLVYKLGEKKKMNKVVAQAEEQE